VIWEIEFKGKPYLFVHGAICTKEQFENFECSYAHLMDDGKVLRFGVQIGTKDDVKFVRRLSSTEKNKTSDRALSAFCEKFLRKEFEFVIGEKKEPCLICGKLTKKIEINYEGRICSKKCCREMDKRFFGALRLGLKFG